MGNLAVCALGMLSGQPDKPVRSRQAIWLARWSHLTSTKTMQRGFDGGFLRPDATELHEGRFLICWFLVFLFQIMANTSLNNSV